MNVKISKCKSCLKCCHGKPGQKISAKFNSGAQPKITKNGICEQLGRSGVCKLGSYRPVECSLYPVIIKFDGLYIDRNCPGHQEAICYISTLIGKYDKYEQKLDLVKV